MLLLLISVTSFADEATVLRCNAPTGAMIQEFSIVETAEGLIARELRSGGGMEKTEPEVRYFPNCYRWRSPQEGRVKVCLRKTGWFYSSQAGNYGVLGCSN